MVVDVSNVRDCLALVKDYFTRTFPNRVFVDHVGKFADDARGTICPHGAPMKRGFVDNVDNRKTKKIKSVKCIQYLYTML